MHTIGRIPRWLLEKDPSWEKVGNSENSLAEWTKRGSDLRAKCNPEDWYCDITISNRSQVFDLCGPVPGLSPANTSITQESDLRKYVSSRYLNPEFATNKLGLNKICRLW